MITISKVKHRFKPRHDEYYFSLRTKKEYGERAVFLTVYKPTPEITELYEYFNVEEIQSKDPSKYPYSSFYMEVYKITEKVGKGIV